MGKLTTVDASAMFAKAGNNQVIQLKGRIEELETEIAQLKSGEITSNEKEILEARIKELVEQLSQQQGIITVPFDEITRNPLQPRLIFPKTGLIAFSNVLKKEGQLDPALLIELTKQNRQQLKDYAQQGYFDLQQPHFDINAKYLIFDGERRWRSCPLAGLEGLKAVILPVRESLDLLELQAKAASTSLHQKPLHKLELAQFLITQVNHRYPDIRDSLTEDPRVIYPRALNTLITRLKRAKRLSELNSITTADQQVQLQWLEGVENDLERAVLDVLLSHQQNPSYVSRHVFPLLKLPNDLKLAAWNEGLEPEKLQALNQLNATALDVTEKKAEAIRADVINSAVTNSWSTDDILERVRELIPDDDSQKTNQPKLPKELSGLQKADFTKLKKPQLQLCEQLLVQRLDEIKKLLN
jgi:ParB family transcriptional regulator, chromosome partitioning protein